MGDDRRGMDSVPGVSSPPLPAGSVTGTILTEYAPYCWDGIPRVKTMEHIGKTHEPPYHNPFKRSRIMDHETPIDETAEFDLGMFDEVPPDQFGPTSILYPAWRARPFWPR